MDEAIRGEGPLPRIDRSVLAAGVIIAAWIGVQWWRMAGQIPIADEADFLRALAHWPEFTKDVPHPPGYLFMLHALAASLGPTVAVIRLAGLLGSLATLAMLPALTRSFVDDPRRATHATLLAMALFGCAPLATQDAVLIDIDNTVMAPTLVALFLFAQRATRTGSRRDLALLAGAFALALWLKLPPPPQLAFALAAGALVTGSPRQAARILLALAAGVALAFGAAAWARSPEFAYSLQANMGRLGAGGGRALLFRAPQTLGLVLVWLGLPTAALYALSVVHRLPERTSARAAACSARIFVVLAGAFYVFLLPPSYGFPKYQSTLWPLLAALTGAMIATQEAWPSAWAFAASVLAGAAIQYRLGDTLYPIYRVSFQTGTTELHSRLSSTLGSFALASAPALAALVCVVAEHADSRRRGAAWRHGLAAAAVGAGLTLLPIQGFAGYSTRYLYTLDRASVDSTVARIQQRVPLSGLVLAPKDILLRAGRRGRFVSDLLFEGLGPDSLREALTARRYAALVWMSKDEYRSARLLGDPGVRALLGRDYEQSRFTDLVLWIRRDVRSTGLDNTRRTPGGDHGTGRTASHP